jgi:protein gp37
MADLFGPWVPDDLIKMVLAAAAQAPQWNFIFLTKYPRRLMEFEFPDNAWVGTTVDTQARVAEAEDVFKNVKARVKWLSCEPMLERLTFRHLDRFQWVVIGGTIPSTKKAAAFTPPPEWVLHLRTQAQNAGCKVYEENLNGLEFCREFPEVGSAP